MFGRGGASVEKPSSPTGTLMWTLRAALPRRSQWRRAQFDTLRNRLVKIAGRVIELKTRVTLHLPTACPSARLLRLVLQRVAALVPT